MKKVILLFIFNNHDFQSPKVIHIHMYSLSSYNLIYQAELNLNVSLTIHYLNFDPLLNTGHFSFKIKKYWKTFIGRS